MRTEEYCHVSTSGTGDPNAQRTGTKVLLKSELEFRNSRIVVIRGTCRDQTARKLVLGVGGKVAYRLTWKGKDTQVPETTR